MLETGRVRATCRRLIAIAAFGVPIGARAQQDPSTVVRKIGGCYTLTLGRWSGPLPTSTPEAHTPPSRFRLDTVAVQHQRSRFAVEPEQLVPGRMAASWAPLPHDSISLFWSTGYIGVTLRLAVRGDSLVGTAKAFRDAHYPLDPPPAKAAVVAARTKCAPRT